MLFSSSFHLERDLEFIFRELYIATRVLREAAHRSDLNFHQHDRNRSMTLGHYWYFVAEMKVVCIYFLLHQCNRIRVTNQVTQMHKLYR